MSDLIGLSMGSPCSKCGKTIGGHNANRPMDHEPVFVSKRSKAYCGECAAKFRVGIFNDIKKLGKNGKR